MTQVQLYPGLTTDTGVLKKSDLEPVSVAAARWGTVSGAENLASIGGIGPAWMLDADATEKIGCSLLIPSFWSTFKVTAWLANTAASVGNVVLFGQLNFTGDGDDISANKVTWLSNASAITVPATTPTIKAAAGNTGLSATAGKWLNMSLQRSGGDVLDTLTNDLAFLGVTLTPQTTT